MSDTVSHDGTHLQNRFFMACFAGCVGAAFVYPIDLVKTRMQNQRSVAEFDEVAYRNSFDCIRKVFRHEGFRGMYKGLITQIIGIGPEKAVLLVLNDYLREKFTDDRGSISRHKEVLAGAIAGFCKCFLSNPIEIIKIRHQMPGPSIGVLTVLKDLGLSGVFSGIVACWLRDIPFAAILFFFYAHNKIAFADSHGNNSPLTIFASSVLAGIPAAIIVTPIDVIKTRQQAVHIHGRTAYNKGIIDAAKKIWLEEGADAFWSGSAARVFRSSPQFGITLLIYELLKQNKKPNGTDGETKQINATPTNICYSSINNINFRTTVKLVEIENRCSLSFPKHVSFLELYKNISDSGD